jgi:hypothetical protein
MAKKHIKDLKVRSDLRNIPIPDQLFGHWTVRRVISLNTYIVTIPGLINVDWRSFYLTGEHLNTPQSIAHAATCAMPAGGVYNAVKMIK